MGAVKILPLGPCTIRPLDWSACTQPPISLSVNWNRPRSITSPACEPIWTRSPTSKGRRQKMNARSEEHTSELQSRLHLVCRLLLEKKKNKQEQHGVHVRGLSACETTQAARVR